MNRAWFLFPLLVLPALVQAKDVYDIRPLAERELMTVYTTVLVDACRFSNAQWHDWPGVPRAGYWGNGISNGNEGIRAISQMVFVSGVLVKYSDAISAADRQQLLDKARAAIQYVVATHKSGTLKCVDGKQWGGDWQSAYWTGTTAFGARLLWEELDDELKHGVERVVASEADRFLKEKPPTQIALDTKAEENGWNQTCLSAAANMFPAHPHAKAWNEKAIEYMMNTLSVASDLKDKNVVDGRPVSVWVDGANLYPDFTLENHSIFHPAYLECSTYMLTQSAMEYAYGHRPIPQAVDYHLMDTWQVLRTIMLPCSESAFPQGMDWELHGLPNINLVATFATYKRDPFAAEKEQIVLQRIRGWQKMQNGDLAVPGSTLGFTRHSIIAEQVAYGYLAHKLFDSGPSETNSDKALASLECVRRYPGIEVSIHRTADKFFSFSWKNRIMGLLVPIGAGFENNPHFVVPIRDGFVGTLEPNGGNKAKTTVVEHAFTETTNGFETTGTLVTNDDRVKQTLCVSSVGKKVVVYQDRVVALKDVSVGRELGVPIGIENDQLSGGERTIYYQGGNTHLDWHDKPREIKISGDWANVDSRLAVIGVVGSGIAYKKAGGYNAQAVCADTLYGSFSGQRRSFKPGDQIARRVILCAVDITPEQTAVLAKSLTIVDAAEGKELRFNLPEGGEAKVPLR